MKGLRTILFNAGVAGATAAFQAIDPQALAAVLGSKWGPAILIGYGVINSLLRTVTTTPVGRKAA